MTYRNGIRLFILAAIILVNVNCAGDYHTFADYPGMTEYYRDRCQVPPTPLPEKDLELLEKNRPRFVLPPGGSYPIDFYRDYTPYTIMRSWPDKKIVATDVTRGLLLKHRISRDVYLDFDRERFIADGRDLKWLPDNPVPTPERAQVVYGRVYRERVSFKDGKGGTEDHDLTFLKYNLLFPTSGLPAKLSFWPGFLVGLGGFDASDWHELDNFVAAHIVLDKKEGPVAVILAQHNHHRTYVVGKDISPDEDGRFTFDVALRSNEIYPDLDSPDPALHRVIRWSLYLDYLLSGEDPPHLKGFDMTYGESAGGLVIDPELAILSPCDPLYTSEMLLGEPRPFFGMYLGRDGPPGCDYYNVPKLLPMGNLLKFGHLHDDDPEDVGVVRETIDKSSETMDVGAIMEHGGERFLREWKEIREK
jgi:hypothetical protein